MKNIEEIIKEIESKYTADDILELLDEEVLNWDYGYNESEIDEYPSRWDFYLEYNNKEAEDAVVTLPPPEPPEQPDGAPELLAAPSAKTTAKATTGKKPPPIKPAA